jgi:polyisoprenoid-binding protein YceI
MSAGSGVRHWRRWLVAGIVGLAVLLVAAPYIYIHFIEGKAPAPITLGSASPTPVATDSTSSSSTGTATVDEWKVTNGSVVGYRVKEVLFGQSNVAVGRTSAITGSITVDGTTITKAGFTVDMTMVASDQSRRDGQFNGRIMETSTYPTATFALTKPIELGSIPAKGVMRTFQATGNLTMHGVTRTVTFILTGRYEGSTFQVAGNIPITFADWNIANPSFGFVTTEDHGLLEFSLNFADAGA